MLEAVRHQHLASQGVLVCCQVWIGRLKTAVLQPAHHRRARFDGQAIQAEVLRRQGLFEGVWCLDESEGLSPGQREEIDRVSACYPDLADDEFVAAHRDEWLSG